MSKSSFARDLFFSIHDGLPRQAPGSQASTAQALRMTRLAGNVDVLDIGCGPGMHTLHLAELLPEAKLTGADAHQPYLDQLQRRAKTAQLDSRINTRRADMKALPFDAGSFDLLWCEAAVYIMGFEAALQSWQSLLKPGGFLAVSDLVWLKDERPQSAIDFWTAYPDMTTLDTRRQTVAANSYELLGDFVLPTSAWMEEYYTPMQARIDLLRQQHAGNAEAETVLAASEQEIRTFESSEGSYGYVFFVIRKLSHQSP